MNCFKEKDLECCYFYQLNYIPLGEVKGLQVEKLQMENYN